MTLGRAEGKKYFLDLQAVANLPDTETILNELEKEIQKTKPAEIHLPDPGTKNYTLFKETILVNIVLLSEKYNYRVFTSERWHNLANIQFGDHISGNTEKGFYLKIDKYEILTVIPEKDLIPGRFYMGRGRNTNIGLWHDDDFITFCYKFGYPMHKYAGYMDDNYEGGCFQPFLLLPTLEEMLFPLPKIIPKEELEEWKFYYCLGGEHNISQWQKREDEFLTWGKGMRSHVCHWTQNGPEYMGKLYEDIICIARKYEEIKPFKKIDEGEMIEPFGEGAWERHYGKKIRIRKI